MQTQERSKPPTDKNDRRRGRPAGKNRVPLSLAERRARNAQYERERRNETAVAMAQLAEAACCDSQITNPELLATVISRLQRADAQTSSNSIEDMKRINKKLEAQIAELESRLKANPDQENIPTVVSDASTTSESESNSDTESSQDQRPSKYRKTAKENTVHDNAKVRRQSRTSSHPTSSSSGSQDSAWSYHQLGKTAPPQEPQPMPDVQLFPYGVPLHKTESTSSESSQSTSSESESDDSSNQSEEYAGPAIKQEEVQIDVQISEPVQIENGQDVPGQSERNYTDPFTELEKSILESLGRSEYEYINFEDNHDGNETSLPWPLDYDEWITTTTSTEAFPRLLA